MSTATLKVEKKPVRKRKSIYPFAEMQVGESFVAPNRTGHPRFQSSILTSAKSWALRNNRTWEFATTKLENGSVRIGRVK